MVFDRLSRHARDQLVREADALRGPERVARAVAVVFAEGLVVRVLGPFGGGEEGAEFGDGTEGGGDGVEGAEVH